MFRKSVPQECPARVSDKNALQECPPRVSHKSVGQECPIRVSVFHKSVPQEYSPRVSHRVTKVSHESVPQESTRVSMNVCAFVVEYVFAFRFMGSILSFLKSDVDAEHVGLQQ